MLSHCQTSAVPIMPVSVLRQPRPVRQPSKRLLADADTRHTRYRAILERPQSFRKARCFSHHGPMTKSDAQLPADVAEAVA
jgi:hypothetical protein